MSIWITVLTSVGSLTGLVTAALFALSFWRLRLFAPTPAVRAGVIASLIGLAIWFMYGIVWIISMVPMGGFELVILQVYTIPYLWQTLWLISTSALAASLLSLAWTLHHGIRNPDMPGSDQA